MQKLKPVKATVQKPQLLELMAQEAKVMEHVDFIKSQLATANENRVKDLEETLQVLEAKLAEISKEVNFAMNLG